MKRTRHHHCALVFSLTLASVASAAGIKVEPFGNTTLGEPVSRVSLENDLHMRVSYIDYGAMIMSIDVPDRAGHVQNIVLSLPDLSALETTNYRIGGVIGRYAGRIGGAKFPLDGKQVNLIPGNNGATLHGGPPGYDRRIWTRRDFDNAAAVGSVFHLSSPRGDQNFPGRLDIEVKYSLLRKRNEFRIEYAARSDAPTVINLTNHAFFNLAGAGHAGLDSHKFQILADRYVETDEKRIPTGVLRPIEGTSLDFRRPAGIADRLASASPVLGNPPGFDHTLLFTRANNLLAHVATIEETTSGRRMEIRTTEPSVQFNSGNGFNGGTMGSEGRAYQRFDGFAFETQHLPDSPNHPDFPSTNLRPGEIYRSQTTFRFSVLSGPGIQRQSAEGSAPRVTPKLAK